MCQVIVQVPAEHGERVLELARRFDGINLSRLAGTDGGGRELAVVLVHVSNASVGPFVDALEAVPEPRISMIPVRLPSLLAQPMRTWANRICGFMRVSGSTNQRRIRAAP